MSKARREEDEDTECFYESLGELWLMGRTGVWGRGRWEKKLGGRVRWGLEGGGHGGKEIRKRGPGAGC
ncbi:unnamed protein product [Prunus armeniaca]|uniref:Uncharacterized protein n=1 Tax=Prunus armeniaca TaxID=36596 RepID=A0A6J5WHD3_PRUAR|nr:unnamed protein product [Prunus armeniaca]